MVRIAHGGRRFFVTRQKKNISHKVLKRSPVNKKQGVTSDQIIRVMRRGKPLKLRRVGYRDPETRKHYVFLISHFTLPARTVAEIYKERWQIEMFFRLIKQNLKIKRFVGKSKNAVLTQIYVAMIMYLLIAFLKFKSQIGWSLQEMFQLLQLNVSSVRTWRPSSNHQMKCQRSKSVTHCWGWSVNRTEMNPSKWTSI